MKRLYSFRKDHRGASLIAVIVAISVVSIIGIVISQLTVSNIQMKEAERQTKKNFYSTEKVMDDLSSGLNKIASDCMQEAYSNMLSDYRTYAADEGSSLKAVFSRLYIESLVSHFNTSDDTTPQVEKKFDNETIDGKTITKYIVGYYSIPVIKGALVEYESVKDEVIKIQGIEESPESAPFYHADFVNGIFVLDGIKVSLTDTANNTTTISTDIVFHTPDVNFNGSNLVKEFMRYSLIADKQILVDDIGIVVGGNVYAGSSGICTSEDQHSNAEFTGNKIITRGNIVVTTNGQLSIGNENSQIWAENIKTDKKRGITATEGNCAKLNLNGNIFVSDDLEINGEKDKVTISGKYYGYNFQKNYPTVALTDESSNAEYSSAIAINGKKSSLNLLGVKRLMIAGRTFISRNSSGVLGQNSDIPLAEAMSVRSNQLAYYVPKNYVNETTKMINDMSAFEGYCGVSDIDSNHYLDASQNVVPYYYVYKETTTTVKVAWVYYLNFSSPQKQNDYFAKYYENKRENMNYTAENYLEANAIMLAEGVMMDLQGNLLYREGTGKLNEIHTNYSSSKWSEGSLYYNFAADHAKQYKSLQLYLEDHYESDDITAANCRLNKGDADTADAEDPSTTLFNNLLNKADLKTFCAAQADGYYLRLYDPLSGDENEKKKIVWIVDNEGKSPIEVNTATYSGGLVIATGDVFVKSGSKASNAQFSGTIISGGIIDFDENSEVEADEVLISQLIENDLNLRDPAFATLFKAFSGGKNSAVKDDRVADYLTFDNWTKTVE